MEQLTPKSKIKFELAQFVTILVFVFGLGTAWASLNAKQVLILTKLEELSVTQKEMVSTRDEQHSILDSQLAWLTPTVHTISRKLGLE